MKLVSKKVVDLVAGCGRQRITGWAAVPSGDLFPKAAFLWT
jgi:hypothetical protein